MELCTQSYKYFKVENNEASESDCKITYIATWHLNFQI